MCAAQPKIIAEKKAQEGAHTHEQHSKQAGEPEHRIEEKFELTSYQLDQQEQILSRTTRN